MEGLGCVIYRRFRVRMAPMKPICGSVYMESFRSANIVGPQAQNSMYTSDANRVQADRVRVGRWFHNLGERQKAIDHYPDHAS